MSAAFAEPAPTKVDAVSAIARMPVAARLVVILMVMIFFRLVTEID
jgi:hypothetical protein